MAEWQATLQTLPQFLVAPFVALFGAIWGSFFNVCIYRLPFGKSVLSPPSRCGHCRLRIRWYDNLPVFGYFLLRGRCRFCGYPFSLRYALVEAICGLTALGLYHHYGIGWQSIFLFVFFGAMLVVTFIDIDHRIIPDEISIGGMVVGVLLSLVMPLWVANWYVTPAQSVLGIIAGSGSLLAVSRVYRWLTQTEGIGLGDVKLLGMIGSLFGWQIVLLTVFVSSLIGSLFGVGQMLLRGRSSKYPIPFGPFIVGGCFLSLWLGDQLLRLLLHQPLF